VLSLPGIAAETNDGALPARSVAVREPEGDGDPLIEAAERALLARGAADTARRAGNAAATADDEDTAPATAGDATTDTDTDTAVRAGNADTATDTDSAVRAGNADTAGDDEDDDVREDPSGAPAESVSETTMELFAPVVPEQAADEDTDDPYTIGPDTHERAADEGDAARTSAKAPRLTDKGLPKRTPRITAPVPTTPKPRAGGVNADELRRRLGGFHQGAREGRRDVEAEIAEQSGETRAPEPQEYRTEAVDTTGGTSEEASS
jgi:hypothetical protein